MVFTIPDWEDGNIKNNTTFSEKAKGAQRNGSPKKASQKMATSKTTIKINGISERSKMINKENKKHLRKQTHTKRDGMGDNKKANRNIQPDKAKNTKNVLPNAGQGTSNNKIQSKQKRCYSKNRNVKKDNSDCSMKVENLDVDKLDEVLLNAKKKKFNEALRNDDVEALLFQEDKSPEVKKENPQIEKQKKMQQSNQAYVANQSLTKKQLFTDKKQKFNNNKFVKAKNVKNNSLNRPIIDNEVFKVKATAGNLDQNSNSTCVLSIQDIKKTKIKKMLKEESNRNPISFNRNKLRGRMLDRLKSAQFRFLNEKLYTSSGSEASQLFQNDPSAFHNYHEGYQQQLKKWPLNPLDVIVKRIQKMPKSHLIADMGCGSAELARRVSQAVRSFDLVATAPRVEPCDMAHTPLLSASVDVAVYCLALMGTGLTAYLLEANRVLKMGGLLLIAEVESRFSDVNAFTKEVARLGFKLQKVDNERDVFFFMEFVKNQDPPVKKSKLPVLTLKPCIYKRR